MNRLVIASVATICVACSGLGHAAIIGGGAPVLGPGTGGVPLAPGVNATLTSAASVFDFGVE